MKTYLATTSILFALIALAHVVRVFQERHLARDPWFIATTVIAVALVVWGTRLLRQPSSNGGRS
jgi:hypothetical protein